AWVRLDRLDQQATALALNGDVTSAVTLGYWPPSIIGGGGLGIAFAAGDSDGATVTRVLTPFFPTADVWYHLAATYDAASGYVRSWMPADNAPGTWPTFWTGAVKAITGFARVDGKSYLPIGAPAGLGASNATQLRLEITATQSRYVFLAGGVHVYLDFISPVE